MHADRRLRPDEATCLVSSEPDDGLRKVGSIRHHLSLYDVKNRSRSTGEGLVEADVERRSAKSASRNPGVFAANNLYRSGQKTRPLLIRTIPAHRGSGPSDSDKYLWITGRAQRPESSVWPQHRRPAEIEEGLCWVTKLWPLAGAIGQPDAHARRGACAFVELVAGASVNRSRTAGVAQEHVQEARRRSPST